MAEAATIGALVNQFIPLAASFFKGRIENDSENRNQIKRIVASLNEVIKKKWIY